LHLSSISPIGADHNWYAAYTQPRHEKAVAQQLEFKGVEVFCPTFRLESKWKDRTVRIAAPLFPGYVFARICLSQRALVLSAPGVIRILSANGRPVPIPVAEIEAVRLCLAETTKLERHSIVDGGIRVRVRTGPFLGLEGTVVRQNDTCKVLVSIAAIQQAVALELDCDCLELVPNAGPLKVA
jgi:transcription antitermination factor NusG